MQKNSNFQEEGSSPSPTNMLSQSIDPKEVSYPSLSSPYFEVALSELRKFDREHLKEGNVSKIFGKEKKRFLTEKYNPIEPDVKSILRDADEQSFNNFSQYKLKRYSGVVIPFSKVSVTNIAVKYFLSKYPHLLSETANSSPMIAVEKILYIVFCGISFPPASHPWTAWDIVYDRVMSSLPEVVGPMRRDNQLIDIEVISLGSPNGAGGSVTTEWIKGLKSNGLSQYGEAYAELLEDILSKNLSDLQNTKLIFQGMSMGCITAERTVQVLSKREVQIRLLFDNPVGNQKGMFSVLKGLQIAFGFLIEGIARSLLDKNVKMMMKIEPAFLENLRSILPQGEIQNDDRNQLYLKTKAALVDTLNLIKGSPFERNYRRIYIRRGWLDPITFSPRRFIKTILQLLHGKNPVSGDVQILEFTINSLHRINRYRVSRWKAILDHCKTYKGVSTISDNESS